MKILIKNLEQMEKTAEKLLRNFSATPSKNSATLFFLSGDLGAGKTTFVQNFAKALNIKDKINSPTFVISKKYKIPSKSKSPWKNLIHIDAYRLNSPQEIKNIGLDQELLNPENIIFIEWAENIIKALPQSKIIKFKYISEKERELEF